MDRRFWVGVLIVFALGAAVFGLAQNQSLNQTQAALVIAQNTATGLSNALIKQATAGAGTQVAEATQALAAQSQAVGDAQSAAATALAQAVSDAQNAAAVAQANALTDAQNMAATAQAQAVTDAQNAAATTQAKTLADAQNAEATEQAEALSQAQNAAATTQAKAVTDAQNAAATTQAQALTDLETPLAATQAKLLIDAQNDAATAQASAVSASESTAATAQAAAVSQAVDNAAATGQAAAANQTALENALATAQAQLTASIPTALSASPTLPLTDSLIATPTANSTAAATAIGTPVVSAGTPASGWTQIVGKGVTLELPQSFTGFNLISGSASTLATELRALGPDFATAANFVEQNPDVFVLLAYDTRSKVGYATNVLILKQDVVVAPPMQSLLDATIAQLPAQITVLDNQIVQVGDYQAGRLTSQTTVTGVSTRQIEYFIIEGTHLWVIVFTTSADEYADRLPVFEQSIQSIQFVPAS